MQHSEQLAHKRHSLAHLLAAAVLKFHPDANPTLGPAVDNGFYYDFEFKTPISEKDLPKIEKEMRKILKTWTAFTHEEVSPIQAREVYKNNPYKLELINEIEGKGEKITLYHSGPKSSQPTSSADGSKAESSFTDLCRGGHVENPSKDINPESFKLSHIAGAYWRGDEKNTMLTRIYGLAFDTKEELETYVTQIEEAKKRDHRKLGKELQLYTIIDEIGPGLPLFYPKGAILRRIVENYIIDEQEKRGYQPIWIPHITKGKLYEISGHLDKYDAMYSPMVVDKENYYLKPMNCPHFMMLYKTLPHSYKELPLRYTCTTTNYRYEKSGELSGLTRVRSLTQDDCHVFATKETIESEIDLMLEMIKDVYASFGFNEFYVRVSLRDSKNKDKYIGSDEVWETAENALRSVVKKTGWKYEEAEDEAAFYGPKLDFMMKDVLGREWQLSTIQLDFNLPERFELEYTDSEGKKVRPIVIHRAILGSTERFLGILIEHTAGNFPLWLSPVQIKILPISENHLEFAKEISKKLKDAGIRAELDNSDNGLGKKVRNAKVEKVPYFLVVGDKEIESKQISLENRDGKPTQTLKPDELLEKLSIEIRDKK